MPAGRPKKERKSMTPVELAEYLGSIGSPQGEVAEALGISVDTLQRDKELCGSHKKGLESIKSKLRTAQCVQAQKGNVVMQIWLGKQLLGQRDKHDLGLSTPDGPIQTDSKIEIILRKPDEPGK